MANHVVITNKGIRTALKRYDFSEAIAEYIWNGFDAQANDVDLVYEANDLGGITSLKVIDNGYGIPQDELKNKFEPFFESEKSAEINRSILHGKNGVGRLTFFKFAGEATWNTIFKRHNKYFRYSIKINSDKLESYSGLTDPLREVVGVKAGTTVSFQSLFVLTQGIIEKEVLNFLKREFAWFLELNKSKKLRINGKNLDYSDIIGDVESLVFTHKKSDTNFEVVFIRWNESLNKEFSRYYYLDSNNKEKWKEYTTLNNKGDHFYHSVYIKTPYFDNFTFAEGGVKQKALIGGSKDDDQFKYLQEQLENLLRKKRKPFLKAYADKLITEYNSEGAFPKFSENEWDKIRKDELEAVVKGLYEVQPKIFTTLNIEQKKTFVGLLNLILDSAEREGILSIVKEVVDLDFKERKDLAKILRSTRLSRVIKTIDLIQERFKIITDLKELVFNEALNANEINHLQKILEEHYWIFGEQYNLVAAAEDKFETALRNYKYILEGAKKGVVKKKMTHPSKNKEMDIFLCRQDTNTRSVKNIVVELKSPKIRLGEKELSQVKEYMRVILSEDEFNAPNMQWEFYLVGNKFNTSSYIEGEIETNKNHGEQSLAFKKDKYKIYVKTWSEVFTELACRFNFLDEKLRLEREKLTQDYKTPEEIVAAALKSTARAAHS